MVTKEEINEIIEELKKRLTFDGRKRVFEDVSELSSTHLIEKSDPEAFTEEFLIDKVIEKLNLEKLPQKQFDTPQGKRHVDYYLKNQNGIKFLQENKSINADLNKKGPDGGINQIKGLFTLAEAKENYEFGIATNGIKWVFIDKNGKIVYDLNILTDFDRIKEILIGKEKVSSEKLEEEISKKFYDWYNALLHGGKYKDHENKAKHISEKDCLVNNVLSVKDLGDREQIAQVVIDRLIFIKFLQSKGIIDNNILKHISELEEDIITPKLKQLFFSVFNVPTEERLDIGEKFKDIPYLNGSLFTLIEVEIKNPNYRIKAEILKKAIEFLNNFAFVHKESLEQSDSLNPEILGYIFEKAMTALDRKGTGAYYTPKPITRYISENTIYPCLIGRVNEFLMKEKGYKETELIKDINDLFILPATTINEIWKNIVLEIKILDNACGSGAFLLTAANILFGLNRKINDILNRSLGMKNTDITLKKLILTRNLYGVDINPNGIEIAKLRLWLWLVDSFDKDHVEPLPNIDYNLRTGNSLIGYVDIGKFSETKFTLNDYFYNNDGSILDDLLRERGELIEKYKLAFGEKAKQLREKIEKINIKAKNLLDVNFFKELQNKGIKTTKEEFLNLKPFHWGFEFYDVFDGHKSNDERGFDIIIGNPPYGNTLNNYEKLFVKFTYPYKTTITNKIQGTSNSASVFIERSYLLLKKGSILGYIVPNSITRVGQFGKIRKFLLDNTYLWQIVDEGSPFTGVTLEMISVFFKKSQVERDYKINIKTRRETLPIKDNFVHKSIFEKFNRFILYFDEIYNYLINGSVFNFIQAPRGGDVPEKTLSTKKDSKHQTPYIYSGKCVQKYFFDENEFHYVTDYFRGSNTFLEELNKERLISTKIYPYPRCIVKPKGMIFGAGVVKLIFDETKIQKKALCVILNSHLIEYICRKYLTNFSNLTMNLNTGILPDLPIKIPSSQQPFTTLCDYMLFLNKIEDRRKSEKELIEFIDKQIIDPLVYELYFKEELKTNLLQLVEPHLKDIENLKSDEEKLKTIKQIVERIKADSKVMREVEKIKSHEWVRILEGVKND